MANTKVPPKASASSACKDRIPKKGIALASVSRPRCSHCPGLARQRIHVVGCAIEVPPTDAVPGGQINEAPSSAGP